jgi:hydrogenase maturation protease
VKLHDYGIRGFDLAYALLEPYETIVLIDAIARGGHPGTVYLLQPDDESASSEASFDAHSMNPASVLAMARFLGKVTANVLIVGCEPQDLGDELEGRMGLSFVVAASVAKAAEKALDCVIVPHGIVRENRVDSALFNDPQGGPL